MFFAVYCINTTVQFKKQNFSLLHTVHCNSGEHFHTMTPFAITCMYFSVRVSTTEGYKRQMNIFFYELCELIAIKKDIVHYLYTNNYFSYCSCNRTHHDYTYVTTFTTSNLLFNCLLPTLTIKLYVIIVFGCWPNDVLKRGD